MKKKTSSTSTRLIGRNHEFQQIRACLKAGKNILLEGPVGVGKTHLALASTESLGLKVFRIDGDNRYSEQKLSGWFDPPLVMKKGFTSASFLPGPLVEAMRSGGVLFINELNRLPEGVQNVLLPAIDERMLPIPRLGEIQAKPGFLVIATQNPKEFVATSHLSEAILDRFELIPLDYQSEDEEIQIVSSKLDSKLLKEKPEIAFQPVSLARLTRNHPKIRRGASVRAALSIAEILQVLLQEKIAFEEAFTQAALLSLPTRIEIEHDTDSELTPQQEIHHLIQEWVDAVLKKKA